MVKGCNLLEQLWDQVGKGLTLGEVQHLEGEDLSLLATITHGSYMSTSGSYIFKISNVQNPNTASH